MSRNALAQLHPAFATALLVAGACQPARQQATRPSPEAVQQATRALSSSLPTLGFNVRTVLGQADGNQAATNRVVPSAAFAVAGVHVRRSSPGDVKIYVVDAGNNRVLAFDGYKAQGTDADRILGQPSGTDRMAPNGEVAIRRAPTASTLAFFQQPILSPTEEAIGIHIDTDSQGNLYVPDAGNNRVLKYNNPFTDSSPGVADDVWGQPGFTTLDLGVGPSQMNLAHKFWVKTVGLDVDDGDNLWVCDPVNHRVMRFRNVGGTIEKNASLCLGQADCNSNAAGGLFSMPVSVQVAPGGTPVWVLEGAMGSVIEGAGKVIKFDRNGGGAYVQDSSWLTPVTLNNPRAMTLDGNYLWIADTRNSRYYKLDTRRPNPEPPRMFDSLAPGGEVTVFPGGVQHIRLAVGLGSFGFDGDDVVFGWNIRGARLGSEHHFPGVVRMSKLLPGTAPEVPVRSLHVQHGENQVDTSALSSLHGMTLAGNQLFTSDDEIVKVYDDFEGKNGLVAPDFTIGTLSNGRRQQLSAGGGLLFVSAGPVVTAFALPITADNQLPVKTLTSGVDIKWANDATTAVLFDTPGLGTGLAYDAVEDVLWLGDNVRRRVLRVKNPTSSSPVVDLVLGQVNKTNGAANAGLLQGATSKAVFDAVFSLALDNFGNLYVVDGQFEGTNGNERVVRFDAAKLVPPANNAIFFNPLLDADAVFARRTWQLLRGSSVPREEHWPNHPVSVAFDRDNHMYLMADGYGDLDRGQLTTIGDASYERVFFFERPHLGVDAILPDKVIKAPFGQAAFGAFVAGAPDRFFVQDHSWTRVVQLEIQGVPSTLSPFVQDPGADGLLAIEAEHHTGRKLQGGKDWIPSAQVGFSGEGALQAMPDTGANVTAAITTSSPRLDFKVKFVKTGTHYLWLRGLGPNGNGDLVHAGLDNAVPTTADSIGPFPGAWTWKGTDGGGARVTFDVPTTGEHTVSLWMQKDGLAVDRLLITSSAGYIPDGNEVESPRPPVLTTTQVVSPEADTYVRDGGFAGTSYGTSATLEHKSSTAAGNHRRTFVRFPIGGVGSTVSSAKLWLHGGSVTSAKLVGVYAIGSTTWSEAMTWNTPPPPIGAKLGASQSVGLTPDYVSWDVTSYLQAQKTAGATAVSFELKQDTANNDGATTFSAREAALNRPQLVVSVVTGGDQPPTVATPAAAAPDPVPGTASALSVLGADDNGEAALTYTWSGPAGVSFSPNGTNAAKNTTATFTAAGPHALSAVIRDAGGQTASSPVTVNVTQTLTSITVAPASTGVPVNGSQAFTATGRDQFGAALATQPSFAWSVNGGGTMTGSTFNAGGTPGGPFTVTAQSGSTTGTAQVAVTPGGPVTLAPEADTYVRDGGSAGMSFGTSVTLEQKNSTAAGNIRRTFVRFPIAGVGGTISLARLRLHGSSVATAKLVGVFAVASVTWNETTLTWNTPPPAIGPKQGSSQSVGLTAGYVEWDVTSYVQQQKSAGATAVSFEVKQDTPNNETPTTFSSREAAGNRPQLVVTATP
jgi:hypothetical protein